MTEMLGGAARRGVALLRGLVQRLRGDWALSLALAIALVGLGLRCTRMFVDAIPLWLDEAMWLEIALQTHLTEPTIRPVGFTALAQFVALHVSGREAALRFVPWLAGVSACFISIPLAWRAFTAPASRLLFVAIIALHPYAIDYSKEFKPYSFSLFVHLFCLLGTISYLQQRSRTWLLATLAVPLFGVLMAQDVLFIFPAIYLVLGVTTLKERKFKELLGIGAGAAATLGLLLLLYMVFWRHMSRDAAGSGSGPSGLVSGWWSQRVDLFYTPNDKESQLGWCLRKLFEFAGFPGERRANWDATWLSSESLAAVSRIEAMVWAVLVTLGTVLLAVRRRFDRLALVLLPIATALAFNLLGRWPFGVYRHNQFMLAYMALLAAAAFDYKLALAAKRFWEPAPALLLVLLPFGLLGASLHRIKVTSGNTEFVELMRTVVNMRPQIKGHPPLLIEPYGCTVWMYYDTIHPGYRKLVAAFKATVQPSCARDRRPSVDARKLRLEPPYLIAAWHPRAVNDIPRHGPNIQRYPIGKDIAVLALVEPDPAAPPPQRKRRRRRR